MKLVSIFSQRVHYIFEFISNIQKTSKKYEVYFDISYSECIIYSINTANSV